MSVWDIDQMKPLSATVVLSLFTPSFRRSTASSSKIKNVSIVKTAGYVVSNQNFNYVFCPFVIVLTDLAAGDIFL